MACSAHGPLYAWLTLQIEVGKLTKWSMLLGMAFVASAADAQVVHKCVDRNGVASYQSKPCADGALTARVWDARPEPPPSNEELWRRYYRKKQGEADSRYLSSLAGTNRSGGGANGHHIRQDGAQNQSKCDYAKRERENTLEAVGMRRTYELLQRLDENVREACK